MNSKFFQPVDSTVYQLPCYLFAIPLQAVYLKFNIKN